MIKRVSVKNLDECTRQEVADYITTHLLTQKKRSLNYRGIDGLMCAAGCLFTDDTYDPEFEGRSWYLLPADTVPKSHKVLILALQHIHDENGPWEWPKLINRLYIGYDLTPPQILLDALA